MTLDHTRDFLHFPGPSPLDMQTTTGILFYAMGNPFCAPGFVFLSGVSAWLAGQRRQKGIEFFPVKTRPLADPVRYTYHQSAVYIRFAIPHDYAGSIVGDRIGMIILALLIRAPIPVIATVAMIILFGHNLLDYVQLPADGLAGGLTKMFLSARGVFIPLSADRSIIVLYTAIPWAGALLLGYCFGGLYKNGYDADKRKRILRLSGISAILLFIVLRLINHYGDPSPWIAQRNTMHTLLSFLNVTKQSPSLLFYLVTLGPLMLLLSFTEKTVSPSPASAGYTEMCPTFILSFI